MPQEIKEKNQELIDKYLAVSHAGEIKGYTEEETKKDFILPLFSLLGWDTHDKKEVSAEEHIKSSGRVDYGFYLNGRIKFYLEAKPLAAARLAEKLPSHFLILRATDFLLKGKGNFSARLRAGTRAAGFHSNGAGFLPLNPSSRAVLV